MSLTLIGKKIGMTQFYDAENRLVPVTVVEVGPCPVVQIKTSDTDGYQAVQIGFNEKKEQRVSKPLNGHFKKAGVTPLQHLREFRCEEQGDEFKVGEVLTVARFSEGQKVDIIASTKGRGFQGVVKRWGFAGQNDSHGSMTHRRSGSIGMSQFPGHVFKNKKNAGAHGNTSSHDPESGDREDCGGPEPDPSQGQCSRQQGWHYLCPHRQKKSARRANTGGYVS